LLAALLGVSLFPPRRSADTLPMVEVGLLMADAVQVCSG
jgi:hypothetical protein